MGRATSDFNRYENLYKVIPFTNNNTNKSFAAKQNRNKYAFYNNRKATAFKHQ
jgi:hypothetical protein